MELIHDEPRYFNCKWKKLKQEFRLVILLTDWSALSSNSNTSTINNRKRFNESNIPTRSVSFERYFPLIPKFIQIRRDNVDN